MTHIEPNLKTGGNKKIATNGNELGIFVRKRELLNQVPEGVANPNRVINTEETARCFKFLHYP